MARPTRGCVLVIDDDVHLRLTVVELLESEGFDVAQASNGYTGLRMAAELRPHAIVLDLALPELPGAQVLAELRKQPRTQDVPVIVLTGHPELNPPPGQGVLAVISKPFDVPQLLEQVVRAVTATETHRDEVPPALSPAPGLAPHPRLVPERSTARSRKRSRR